MSDMDKCEDRVYFVRKSGQRQTSSDWSVWWDGYCRRYPVNAFEKQKDDWCGEFKIKVD